jgi:hypothetical protein
MSLDLTRESIELCSLRHARREPFACPALLQAIPLRAHGEPGSHILTTPPRSTRGTTLGGPPGPRKKLNPIPSFLSLDRRPLLKGALARDKLKKRNMDSR